MSNCFLYDMFTWKCEKRFQVIEAGWSSKKRTLTFSIAVVRTSSTGNTLSIQNKWAQESNQMYINGTPGTSCRNLFTGEQMYVLNNTMRAKCECLTMHVCNNSGVAMIALVYARIMYR